MDSFVVRHLMPRESFYFEGHRPRWTKIRKQWWGDLLVLILCALIVLPLFFHQLECVGGRSGVWEWLSLLFSWAVGVYLLGDCLRSLLRSIRRYRELMNRCRRLQGRG